MLRSASTGCERQVDWLVAQNIDPRHGKQSTPYGTSRPKQAVPCEQESLFYSLDDHLGIDSHYRPEWTDEEILTLQEGLLIDAIKQLIQYKSFRRCSLFTESRDWINSDEEHGFSFITCCDAIPVDPDALRETLFAFLSGFNKEPE